MNLIWITMYQIEMMNQEESEIPSWLIFKTSNLVDKKPNLIRALLENQIRSLTNSIVVIILTIKVIRYLIARKGTTHGILTEGHSKIISSTIPRF